MYPLDENEMLPEFGDEMPPEAEVGAEAEAERQIKALGFYIRELFHRYDGSTARAEALKTARESRRCYEMEAGKTGWPWPGASNMVTPMTRIGVDELEPRLVSAVVGREPYLKVEPYEGASTKDEAFQVQAYVNFVLKRKCDIQEVVSDAVHELLLDGTLFYVASSGPKVFLVPLDYVWLPDNVDDEDWERYPVIRYVDEYSIWELEQRAQAEDGWILPALERLNPSGRGLLLTGQQEAASVGDSDDVLAPELQTVQCLEAYLTYPLFGIPETLIVLVDRETFEVLRIRRQAEVFTSDVKLIQRLSIFRKRGVSWGNPLYKNIKGIQEGMDAMWNRCINSADITMTPWGFVQRGMSGSLKSKLQVTPGSLFEVDKPDAFVFPSLGQFNPTSFVPLILQYINFFQRLTVSDFMQGHEDIVAGKKGTTATGTLAILQEGKVKHDYRGGRIHHQFFRMFMMVYNMIADNLDQTEVSAITGAPIEKPLLEKAYIFDVGGSSATANKFIDRKEHEDFLATSQPFMGLFNLQRLLMDHLEVYEKKPKGEYLDPELSALIQQFLMRKQAIQALEQAGLKPEVAQQAADLGVTPDSAGEFLKQMVKQTIPGEEG